MTTWIATTIAWRQVWAPGLVSLRLDARLQFAPGQFTNLGLEQGGTRERRAYSLASKPGELAEFYLNEVTGGGLSPHLFHLKVGDAVQMDTAPSGFFTLAELPLGQDAWLLATGTGLAPFLSMLRSGELGQRFEKTVLVHGVREHSHLGYRQELEQRAAKSSGRFSYLPVISREQPAPNGLAGRIPELIRTGQLESKIGVSLDPQRSRVLLCGNPQMIVDTRAVLEQQGLQLHRRRAPGHILMESYW